MNENELVENLASVVKGLVDNDLHELKKKIRAYGMSLLNAIVAMEEERYYDFKHPVLVYGDGYEEEDRIIRICSEGEGPMTLIGISENGDKWFIEALDFRTFCCLARRVIEEKELNG